MAGIAYDTSELVTTLKDRGLVPTNAATFDTAAYLRACTQVMYSELLAELLSVRNQYLTWYTDQALVVGQSSYRIPHRAIGGKIEDVEIINTDGSHRKLDLIIRQDLAHLLITTTTATGIPQMFYLENHEVVLYPSPSDSAPSLRIAYAIRPGKLVPTTTGTKITSITPASPDATHTRLAGTSPTPAFNTTTTRVDLIAGHPGFQHLALDLLPTGVAVGTLDFLTSALPTGAKALTVGDWVNLSEESCVPQIPAEHQAILAVLGLAAHLEAVGDMEGAAKAQQYGERQLKLSRTLITPRVNLKTKKTVNRNWFYGRRR